MYIRQSHLIIVFSALCAIALVSGIWGLIAGYNAIAALVFAVLSLVMAQLVLFLLLVKPDQTSDTENSDQLALLYSIDDRLARLEETGTAMIPGKQLTVHETPLLDNNAEADVMTGTANQKHNSAQQAAASTPPAPFDNSDAAGVFSGPFYLDDKRLSLFLEPVVEIASMKTGFYRAELSVLDADGLRHFLSQLEEQVTDDGNSAASDLKLFARLGPVIERLVEKQQVTGVVCPISRFSFANEAFLQELTRHLKKYPDLARLLVIEITQPNLAGLSQQGMAGLAFLAQAGATFCLGGAGLESPDLASLKSLGFRYLDLDYSENISRYGFSAFGENGAASDLRDKAHDLGISIIGSGLERKAQADALNHFIDFGRGTAFSPPRLVRDDLGNSVPTMKAA